jgi:hypothetical protein
MLEARTVAGVVVGFQGWIKKQIRSRFATSRTIGKLVSGAQVGLKI